MISSRGCIWRLYLIVIGAVIVGAGASVSAQPVWASEAFENAAPAWFDRARQTPFQEASEAGFRKMSRSRSVKTLWQWSYGTSFSGGPNLDEPLVTDRPDFTEASSTVGLGVLQLESGYTYTRDGSGVDATAIHSFPETLFRYGVLADWLEFRVQPNVISQRAGSVSTTGADDLNLGFKIGLTPQEGILPEMALIPQMTVPVGAKAFSANEVLPGLILIYGWEFNEYLKIAGQTFFDRAIDDVTSDSYTEWSTSWSIGYTLTEKLGAYTEWYALLPHSADAVKPEHYFDGGFTYLLSNDVQWDIRGGVGLNGPADDQFVGTGLSIRFK